MKDVLHLAWPSVLSFVLHNGFRINDQFCVKELGPAAQGALGSSIFVLIMNFAVFFLVMGGTLPLVGRATGAGDTEKRESVIQHSLVAATAVGLILAIGGGLGAGGLTSLLGLEGATGAYATEYLRVLYICILPMAIVPVVDGAFVGMGNTRIPLLMQGVSITTNFALNMALIYGSSKFAWLPFEGMGMTGAASATAISRLLAAGLGLFLLKRLYGIRILPSAPLQKQRFLQLIDIGLPNALSIATYAGVYWLLFNLVITDLGDATMAGLSIGFNVFEGVSFPFFLGVAIAGSSIVGRALGAGDPQRARQVVSRVRVVATIFGLLFGLLFFFASPFIALLFTEDPAVVEQAVLYCRYLAFTQFFVAHEATSEKVLWGSGHTKAIFMISVPGNLLRVPLAILFTNTWGYGAAGVWMAINLTTGLKSAVFYFAVRLTPWAEKPLREDLPRVEPAD